MHAAIAKQLKEFVSLLPEEKKRRFNEGLQKDLVECLADGKIRTRTAELMEDQQKLERRLHEERENCLRSWQGDPNLEQRLLDNDARILKLIDEMCQRQQAVLHGFKVPAFRQTQNPRDIELQMMILEFIVSLHN